MFLSWMCFGVLISNIILSEQFSPFVIKTSTKCRKENQRIQGFTPSQFFQCIRKGNRLYFEARYCPNRRYTFYETKQRCLPNIGGGEVRCLISGKRCPHNMLGPMAYLNKFKPNYYIVCLPNAVHICRCYGNAIYDKSIHMCRFTSKTTDIGRDDSHGIISKVLCKRSGIHSTVKLTYPYKQKCVLLCNQKRNNRQFELNIICTRMDGSVNIPDENSLITEKDNIPPEVHELTTEEFSKSTNSYDTSEWPLEISTTINIEDEEETKGIVEEMFLESLSTEDESITWTTDQDILSYQYDERTSETSAAAESIQYDTSPTINTMSTSTLLSEFSTIEDEVIITTTEKVLLASLPSQDGRTPTDSDQNFTKMTTSIPFLTDDEPTEPASENTSSESPTREDGSIQSVTEQNFSNNSSSTLLTTTEHGSVQTTEDEHFTEKTSTSLFLITKDETIDSTTDDMLLGSLTENGSTQSTTDQNFTERTTGSSFVTDNETTRPPREKYSSESSTTEDSSTQTTIDQNFNNKSSNPVFITEEATTEIVTLISRTTRDGNTQSTTDKNFKESTVYSHFTITDEDGLKETTDDERPRSSSKQTPSESHTIGDGNPQSTTVQIFKESSVYSPSTIIDEDGLKNTASSTVVFITNQSSKNTLPTGSLQSTKDENFTEVTAGIPYDETIKQSSEISSSASSTTEDGGMQSTIDLTNPSSKNIAFLSSTTEDVSTHSTIDHNFNKSSSSPIFDITEETTEIITSISPTIGDENAQSTTNQNFKGSTVSSLFTITNDDQNGTTSETLELTTNDETITQSSENFSPTESLQSTTDHRFTEITVSFPLLTDDETTGQSSENTPYASSSKQDGGMQSVTDQTNLSSKNILLSSSTIDDGSTTSTVNQNSNESISSPIFNTIEEKTTEIVPSISHTTEDGNTQSTSNQNFKDSTVNNPLTITDLDGMKETTSGTLVLTTNQSSKNILFTENLQSTTEQKYTKITTGIPLLTDDEATQSSKKSSYASSTIEDGSMQWVTNQTNKNIPLVSSTTEYGSTQSTTDHNINESSSSRLITATEEGRTEIINSISHMTGDGNTQWPTDQNFTESTVKSPFTISDGDGLKETTSGNLVLTTDNETINQSSENILLGGSLQSTTDKAIKDSTSKTIFSTTEDEITDLNQTTFTTLFPITGDDGERTTTSLESLSTEVGNIQLTKNQNIETTSSSRFLSSTSTTKPFSSTETMESTSKLITSFSPNAQSTETKTDTDITSTNIAYTKPPGGSLSQISTTESSTASKLDVSEILQTNTPKQNLESTTSPSYSSSDAILLPGDVTDTSTNDEDTLLNTVSESYITKESSTTVNGYSQLISSTEDLPEQIELNTTSKNVFTIETDTQPGGSSTERSTTSVSKIRESVNTTDSISENSQQTSTFLETSESEKYTTVTSRTEYEIIEQTTIFIEPADSDKDDYNTTSEFSTNDDDSTTHILIEDKENISQQFTTENDIANLNVDETNWDQDIAGSLPTSSEFEISTITIEPNLGFTEKENLKGTEPDSSSPASNVEMGERCVCTGKTRYRNSCKKYYHCNKIRGSDRYVQSEIMECDNCFQFNAKSEICDFPENVPECSIDDGSFNRTCTAEGNYSIPLEGNCRKYYECKINWKGVIELKVKICEVGSIFSERLQKCVQGCRCRNAQQLPDGCENKNAIPDRFNCSKYYYCDSEIKIRTLQCSDQYVFDGKKCELKSEVICDPTNVLSYLSGNDDENCNT